MIKRSRSGGNRHKDEANDPFGKSSPFMFVNVRPLGAVVNVSPLLHCRTLERSESSE